MEVKKSKKPLEYGSKEIKKTTWPYGFSLKPALPAWEDNPQVHPQASVIQSQEQGIYWKRAPYLEFL